MKDLSIGKALGIFFVFLIVFSIVFVKFLGAFYIVEGTKLIEKDAFCKITQGEEWKYDEDKEDCYDKKDHEIRETFSEKEFREVCPKNEFISTKFYSDCFHQGDPRSR